MQEQMLDYYTDVLQDENIIAWIIHHKIKTERGRPISFDDFAFMIDPYLDWSPLQGVRKSAQCGWSIMTNLKLFYAAKFGIPNLPIAGANVIYTLPSDNDVKMFVPSKTNLLIQNNPILQKYLRDEMGAEDKWDRKRKYRENVNSVYQKKIEGSMVYFKGTRSHTAALMISSDLNIHDESDRSEQAVIEQYESRLEASTFRGRWIFSNPSFPNMPADAMFLASDQKHWFIKCEHCGWWQYMDWKKLSEHEFVKAHHCYVDDVNGQYVCGACAAPISDETRKRGRWIPKFPNKPISGYWISQLIYPWKTAKDLLDTEKNKSKDYFMNFVLGLPYVGSDVVITAQTLVNNMVLDKPAWEKGKVAMGVDNGDTKHYVIGDTSGIFEIGKTGSWDDIELLIKKYDPYFVIDLNPYPRMPRDLAKKYGKGAASFYTDNTKDLQLVKWGENDKSHMVFPDRNRVFDDLVGYIAEGGLKFYGAKAYWEEYIGHWETMYRADMVGTRRAEDVGPTTSIVRGVWQSSTGEDHFCHATLFYYVALSRLLRGRGKILGGGNTVAKAVQSVMGPIKTVPEVKEGAMQYGKSFIPDLSTLNRRKKSGSTSGNM